ncbi:MAG: PaaI family thioesterase [Pseudomonadota bacterium]
MTTRQSEAASYLTMAKTFFGTSHPLFNAFGIEVEEIGKGRAVMSMPCSVDLSNRRGGLHRGVIVTLLDTNCGLAIFSRLGDMRPIATIDLRVDFIKEAPAGAGVRGEVECYAVKGNVAYVRGQVVACSDHALLASVSGSFAVGTLGPAFDSAMKAGV